MSALNKAKDILEWMDGWTNSGFVTVSTSGWEAGILLFTANKIGFALRHPDNGMTITFSSAGGGLNVGLLPASLTISSESLPTTGSKVYINPTAVPALATYEQIFSGVLSLFSLSVSVGAGYANTPQGAGGGSATLFTISDTKILLDLALAAGGPPPLEALRHIKAAGLFAGYAWGVDAGVSATGGLIYSTKVHGIINDAPISDRVRRTA